MRVPDFGIVRFLTEESFLGAMTEESILNSEL